MNFFRKSKRSAAPAPAEQPKKAPQAVTPIEQPIKWDSAGDIRLRNYESYEAYRDHQVSKLAKLDLTKYTAEFKSALSERIGTFPNMRRGSTVLCLGARNGAECEVFIEKGYFAVGIDLNPGQANKTVLTGDFHNIQFADESVDMVFTNALDHTFDLDKVLSEVRRVLKPRGIFIAEIVRGSKDEEGREPGAFESTWWDNVDAVVNTVVKYDLTHMERNRFSYPWNGDQCIFTKV